MGVEKVLSVDLVAVLLSILIHEHGPEVLCEQLCVGPQTQPEMHSTSEKWGITMLLMIKTSDKCN
jgi:hypothetical protein